MSGARPAKISGPSRDDGGGLGELLGRFVEAVQLFLKLELLPEQLASFELAVREEVTEGHP